ncbi:MAG: hypothetical protein R3E98_14670 [Gemmatimonadota bacterium]
MPTTRRLLLAFGLLIGGGPAAVAAQEGEGQAFSVEARLGVSFPTGELSRGQRGIATNAGISRGVSALLRVRPGLGLYGGWSRHGVACSGDSDCAPDAVVASSGFEAGVRIVLPHQTVTTPWFRGGVTLHRFSYDLDGVVLRSDVTPGVEVGVGADVRVHRFLALAPALRFVYYRTDINLETFNTGAEPFQVSALVVDLGARLRF